MIIAIITVVSYYGHVPFSWQLEPIRLQEKAIEGRVLEMFPYDAQ